VFRFALPFLLVVPALCAKPPTSYWIWTGITPEPYMQGAPLYIFQGTLSEEKGVLKHTREGLSPHALAHEIHLVYRATHPIPDAKNILAVFHTQRLGWEKHGVRVKGIQIDADVPTRRLKDYAKDLARLRARLGKTYALSVTGLGDWTGAPYRRDFLALTRAVDEMVIQLYQARTMHKEHARFTRALCASGAPFKLGLLAKVDANTYLEETRQKCPGFQGVALFVQKEG